MSAVCGWSSNDSVVVTLSWPKEGIPKAHSIACRGDKPVYEQGW